jgi:hypothetical protein
VDAIQIAVGVVLLVAAVVAAKRAGWLDGSDEDLREAVRAEEAARARPKG